MKYLLLYTLLVSCAGLARAQQLDTFRIKTSAVCDMCKETLEYQMALEKGVKWSELDLYANVLSVAFKPNKTDSATIKKRVSLTGYDANEIPANKEAYGKLPLCCQIDLVEEMHPEKHIKKH